MWRLPEAKPDERVLVTYRDSGILSVSIVVATVTPTPAPDPTTSPRPVVFEPTNTPLAVLQPVVVAAAVPPTLHTVPRTLREVLQEAGWTDDVINDALLVVRGPTAACPNGESGGNADSANQAGPYLGLFQLSEMWFPYFGESLDNWADPVINARVAYKLYLRSGWAPWPHCGR